MWVAESRNARVSARRTWRNGRRERLRTGSFFPSLPERRRRIDRALFAVVTEAYERARTDLGIDENAWRVP